MRPWLVGLDVGTTSCKAVVMAPDGREVAAGRAPTPWTTTALGTQTDGEALVDAARAALSDAVAAAPPGRILGVGVASMAESGVLLADDGRAVAPLIAWHDTRDAAETAALRAELGAQFSVCTGLPLRQQWSLTKHRWQLDHDEAAATGVRRLGVAEWIVHALGGEQVSELSLASRTGWLDLGRRDWWDEALAWSGARRSLLPELVASGEPVGTAHDRWGIPGLGGAALTVAGHDHQAAAVGAGVAGAGDVLDSHGSAEAVLRTVSAGLAAGQVEALAAAGITTDLGVRVGNWSLLGGTQGGLVLRHTLDELGVVWADLPVLDAAALAADCDAEADSGRAGADTCRAGGGASRAGAGASRASGGASRAGDDGGRTGPRPATAGGGAKWRAVIEAETGAAAERIATMARIVGPHQRLVVTGGWCASAAVLAAKRRLFGPLVVADVAEAGTLGAATLAARAAGALGPADALA